MLNHMSNQDIKMHCFSNESGYFDLKYYWSELYSYVLWICIIRGKLNVEILLFFLQSESFKQNLVIMERAVNLNTYQPRQASYRGQPIVEGTLFILHYLMENESGFSVVANNHTGCHLYFLSDDPKIASPYFCCGHLQCFGCLCDEGRKSGNTSFKLGPPHHIHFLFGS